MKCISVCNPSNVKTVGVGVTIAIRDINGMVYFMNTNNEFNVYVHRNHSSVVLFTKSDFN